MKEAKECPNCGAELKTGFVSSNKLLSAIKITTINLYAEHKKDGYCNKCGKDLFAESKEKLQTEIATSESYLKNNIHQIPIVTSHSPFKWEYDCLGLVTGQSTTGTGVVSEFTSSFTDFFGTQSGAYNKKIRQGEELCMSQLQTKTLTMGGNAVLAADIDYSELGSLKGMIMVCMSGTAIKILNEETLGKEKAEIIRNLSKYNERLALLKPIQEKLYVPI